MGRIRTFDIVIDNNVLAHVDGMPVYSTGNQVTGVVNLNLNTSREDVRGETKKTYIYLMIDTNC